MVKGQTTSRRATQRSSYCVRLRLDRELISRVSTLAKERKRSAHKEYIFLLETVLHLKDLADTVPGPELAERIMAVLHTL